MTGVYGLNHRLLCSHCQCSCVTCNESSSACCICHTCKKMANIQDSLSLARLADWPKGGMTGVTQCQWSAHCPDIAVKLWSRQSSDTFVSSAAKLGDLLTTDRS